MRGRAATEVPAGVEKFDSGRQPQRNSAVAKKSTGSTREAILGAMLEVVGLVGYESTSLGVVLGRAGISRRSFELEFEGKEDSYLTAYDAALEEVAAMLRDATKDESDWLGRLRVGLNALLAFLDSEPQIARALLVEVRSAGRRGKARWAEDLDRVAEFLDLARREPGAIGSPPEITGKAVASGIYGMVRSRLTRRVRGGVQELLPELVHFAVSPYFGSEVAAVEMQAALAMLGSRRPEGRRSDASQTRKYQPRLGEDQ